MKNIIKKTLMPLTIFAMALGIGLTLNKKVVDQKVSAASFTQVTDANQLVSGKKYLITANQYNTSNYAYIKPGNYSAAPAATSFSDVSLIDSTETWTFNFVSGSGWQITDGTNYLYTTATNNGLRSNNTTTQYWSFANSANSGYTTGRLTAQYTGTSRYLTLYLAQDWRSYTTVFTSAASQEGNLVIYELNEGAPAKVLTNLTKSGDPIKTNYYAGESFDYTGITLTAHFDDLSTIDVTTLATFSPDPLTLGLTSVTASYTFNGLTQTTTISGITVNPIPTLEIIVISGTMTKTDYQTTEAWSPDGLIVTAVYSDDSEVVVTDDVTWSYNPAAPNSTTITSVDVTATYEGVSDTKTINVTVTEKVSTVVISEAYGGGGNSGAPYRNDFVELYNNTDTAIDLSGWAVHYASATGTFNNSTELSGSILPRSFFLIQWADGSNGDLLPTADVVGNIAAGQANFKVALTNTTEAPTSPTDSNVVDYLGVGTANVSEGNSNAPAASNANSVARAIVDGVAVDTDNNGNDFTASAPTPMNSALSIAEKIMESDTEMQCITKFPEMKALVVQLSEGQLGYFQSTGNETLMINARARYVAWAAYLGDNEAYATGSSARSTTTNSSSNNVAAIALIGVIGLTALVGYYFINKKKLTA